MVERKAEMLDEGDHWGVVGEDFADDGLHAFGARPVDQAQHQGFAEAEMFDGGFDEDGEFGLGAVSVRADEAGDTMGFGRRIARDGRVGRDEGEFAGVVDLGHADDLFRGEAAHGGEKSAADVFGGDAGEKPGMGGGVFGADGADDEGFAVQRDGFDAVGRIGADGERDGGLVVAPEVNPRTGGGDAGGGREERVDFQAGDDRPIDHELTDANEGVGESIAVGHREATAQAEQIIVAGTFDQGLGQSEVERQKFDGFVTPLGGVAAAGAEADDRAEGGVGLDADIEFASGLDLRLDDKDRAVRPFITLAQPGGDHASGGAGGSFVREVERDGAVRAVMGEIGVRQFDHDGKAEIGGGGGDAVRVGGDAVRWGGDAIGSEERKGLALVEPSLVGAGDIGEHGAHGILRGGDFDDGGLGKFAGGGAGITVTEQIGKAADSVFGCGERGEAGGAETMAQRTSGGIAKDRDQERLGDAAGAGDERIDRGVVVLVVRGGVDHQDAADFRRAGEQGGEIGEFGARDIEHGDGAGGVRRLGQAEAEHAAGFIGKGGEGEAGGKGGIGGEASDADAVAEDRERAALGGAGADEGFGGGEERIEPGGEQDAGARQSGFVGAQAQRARVGEARTGGKCYDRAQAGGGAGGGEKQAGVAQLGDVEQDQAGAGIAREIIEQAAKADIGIAADADDMGKADAIGLGPIDHGAGDGGGLGQQRDAARGCRARREQRIQADGRVGDPKGATADDADMGGAGGGAQAISLDIGIDDRGAVQFAGEPGKGGGNISGEIRD